MRPSQSSARYRSISSSESDYNDQDTRTSRRRRHTSPLKEKLSWGTLRWSDHPELTDRLIKLIRDDPSARRWTYFVCDSGSRSHNTKYIFTWAAKLFKDHPNFRMPYARNRNAFELTLRKHLIRLKNKYRKLSDQLGLDGGSEAVSARELTNVRDRWPLWDKMYQLWGELPRLH
ncbi:hypothetical protein SISNIDRAFT_276588 [Sistotremastrum niveocremeum HHB9708]|uniref:Uncharacterized protein n=1 Tax=Sistotremastrum niveocremeum HHB9708 TaxID=1314777 RepID=A0A164NTQ8_9AGAM|nr:hypothetical protein SISNIDRAFT_276588 [Sistotremastrum niveocremeum HHB9708]